MLEPSTLQTSEKAELDLLRLIGDRSELSQREIVSSLGVSLGKANHVLRALIKKGFVKAQNYRKSRDKLLANELSGRFPILFRDNFVSSRQPDV